MPLVRTSVHTNIYIYTVCMYLSIWHVCMYGTDIHVSTRVLIVPIASSDNTVIKWSLYNIYTRFQILYIDLFHLYHPPVLCLFHIWSEKLRKMCCSWSNTCESGSTKIRFANECFCPAMQSYFSPHKTTFVRHFYHTYCFCTLQLLYTEFFTHLQGR